MIIGAKKYKAQQPHYFYRFGIGCISLMFIVLFYGDDGHHEVWQS